MKTANRAFSLVEVSLALGITAFCLLAVFGLLPVGLNTNQSAYEQTLALEVSGALISDLHSTAASSTQSPLYRINIPTPGSAPSQQALFLTAQGVAVAQAAQARYLAVVSATAPPANQSMMPAHVHILLTWPAAANASVSGSGTDLRGRITNFAGSVETIAAISRQ